MKRGEFSREQKRWEIAAVAVALVGAAAVAGCTNGSPDAPNAAVAAAEQTSAAVRPSNGQEESGRLQMNELGIPEKACGWIPSRPQYPELIEGRWQVLIDGRCRDQIDDVVRAYTVPSEDRRNMLLIEGATPDLSPGKAIVAICAKKGELVVADSGTSNRWIRTEFSHRGEALPAWVSAADAGFVNAYGPPGSPPPVHTPALPNCPEI